MNCVGEVPEKWKKRRVIQKVPVKVSNVKEIRERWRCPRGRLWVSIGVEVI